MMKRFIRRPLHVVLLLLLCLVVASACSSASQPASGTRATSSAIVQGQVDTAGDFRYIARVDPPSGFCSGTLISRDVVLTAAHCVEDYAQGCGTFRYVQPETYHFSVDPPPAPAKQFRSVIGYVRVPVRVEFAQAGSTLEDDNNHSLPIPVDAIRVHPRGYQVNLEQCSGTCGTGEDYQGLFTPFDVALLHLAVPLDDPRLGGDGIIPAHYIAGFTTNQPSDNRYLFDPSSALHANQTRVVVGGTSEQTPPAAREIALSTFVTSSIGTHYGSTTCDKAALVSWSSEGATFQLGQEQAGDGCPNKGDSGGPLILNAYLQVPGASAITTLPLGLALVAGDLNSGNTTLGSAQCAAGDQPLYAATWDANVPGDATTNPAVYGDTQTGTFLNDSTMDWDKDGSPDVGQPGDNCPTAYQNEQDDCNALAEVKQGYPARGDMCDPVPCAAAKAPAELPTPITPNVLPRRTLDIVLEPSHRVAAQDHHIDITPPVTPIVVNGVRTDVRFCQEDDDPTNDVHCSDPALIDDALLDTAPTQGVDKNNPWLPVTISEWGGPWALLDYDGGTITVHWDYLKDSQRWENSGQIRKVSTDNACGHITRLKGRLWFHTETAVGTYPAQTVNGQTADYRLRSDGTGDGTGLADSYLDIAPDVCSPPIGGLVAAASMPPFSPAYPIRWPHPYPYPDAAFPPSLAPPQGFWDLASSEDGMLMKLTDGRFGMFRDDSYFFLMDDLLGTRLKAELADPSLVWTGAVEPRLDATRRILPEVQAVALSADGTTVVDGAYSAGSGLQAISETPPPGDPPPPRHDFVPVFTRIGEAVFVVGGSHPGSDQPMGDIWYDGLLDEWHQAPLKEYAPARVLAATWSFRDDLLWVLDERGAHGHGDGRMRLVRIDPHLGVAMPIAQWRRDGYDAYYLSIDHDGNVLFTRASSHTPRYVVARYVARPWESNVTPTVASCVLRPGTLMAPPLVDPGGYTFVIQSHGVPHVDRVTALPQGALAQPSGLCRL